MVDVDLIREILLKRGESLRHQLHSIPTQKPLQLQVLTVWGNTDGFEYFVTAPDVGLLDVNDTGFPFPFSTEAPSSHPPSTPGIAFSNARLSNLFVKVCLCILCADNAQMHLRGSPERWVFFYVESKHVPDQSGVEAGWVAAALHFIVVMYHDQPVFPYHCILVTVHIHDACSAAHAFAFLLTRDVKK